MFKRYLNLFSTVTLSFDIIDHRRRSSYDRLTDVSLDFFFSWKQTSRRKEQNECFFFSLRFFLLSTTSNRYDKQNISFFSFSLFDWWILFSTKSIRKSIVDEHWDLSDVSVFKKKFFFNSCRRKNVYLFGEDGKLFLIWIETRKTHIETTHIIDSWIERIESIVMLPFFLSDLRHG